MAQIDLQTHVDPVSTSEESFDTHIVPFLLNLLILSLTLSMLHKKMTYMIVSNL